MASKTGRRPELDAACVTQMQERLEAHLAHVEAREQQIHAECLVKRWLQDCGKGPTSDRTIWRRIIQPVYQQALAAMVDLSQNVLVDLLIPTKTLLETELPPHPLLFELADRVFTANATLLSLGEEEFAMDIRDEDALPSSVELRSVKPLREVAQDHLALRRHDRSGATRT